MKFTDLRARSSKAHGLGPGFRRTLESFIASSYQWEQKTVDASEKLVLDVYRQEKESLDEFEGQRRKVGIFCQEESLPTSDKRSRPLVLPGLSEVGWCETCPKTGPSGRT